MKAMKAQMTTDQMFLILLMLVVLFAGIQFLTRSGESGKPSVASAALMVSCGKLINVDRECKEFETIWVDEVTEVEYLGKKMNLKELCEFNHLVNEKGEADIDMCKIACECPVK